MSKSESGNGHALLLTADEATIRGTHHRATPDTGREIRFSDDPARAGVNNLLTIYQMLTGKAPAQVEADFADARGYADLKSGVADVVEEAFRPIRAAHARFLADPAELDRMLALGAERARAVAEPKVTLVKERMGIPAPAGPA
jgi:tryptophanyl-tRNA synthetase